MAAASSAFFFGLGDMQMQPQGSTPVQNSVAALGAAAPPPPPPKKKRNPPGNPSNSFNINIKFLHTFSHRCLMIRVCVVIALSPRTLMATNRFVCEVCHKGFQREKNLQLHRRGHNLPWKLKQKDPKEARPRVYLCLEPTCKHYCRKHGEKTLKCGKCDKLYAVEADWKAHSKTCGTREYRCDACGELSSPVWKGTYDAHRSFCNMAPRESAEMTHMGADDLDVGSGSISLGLSGAATQIHGLADQYDRIMLRSQAPSSSSFFPGSGALSPAQDFSEDGEYSQAGQGLCLLHGKSPFPGMMQLPEQQQPGSSNANGNLLNLGYFSGIGNDGGSETGQDARRLVTQDQFNGSGGGSNSDHGGVMAPVGSHGRRLISGGFPSLYNSSPSAAPPQHSATALLMKAAQMGSTSSADNGPSTLLRAAGFGAASRGQGTSRSAAAEAMSSHAAHFHDLIMNSLAGGGGGGGGGGSFSSGAAGFGAMDDGNMSTRDFLGGGTGAAMAPSSGRLRVGGAPDRTRPTQTK
ncbi:hypothetical protein PVAP13_2NG159500 [Panicum virgatum]|uniref:C2H2-type domain-containing protein n=1 Tax=Panicum virgatum TaxID=38727 RepID=A0A8T0VQK7_PANVG|nr:hypothetical protein PVAP13_2NG159500 [Panicum virgatum]